MSSLFIFIIVIFNFPSISSFRTSIVTRQIHPGISRKVDRSSDRKKLNILHEGEFGDLPSLFGINPIEAAVLFGVLYYIYGPNVLYDYAKEAGKFVGTYGPVVSDLSKNIFFEFRDYFEENKERDLLKKQGFNVESLPRRTTNIIDRFTESMKLLSIDDEENPDSERRVALRKAFSDEGDEDVNTVKFEEVADPVEGVVRKQRRNKKAVLEKRAVDVEEVMKAVAKDTTEDLKETLANVQSQLAMQPLKSQSDKPLSSFWDTNASSPSSMPWNRSSQPSTSMLDSDWMNPPEEWLGDYQSAPMAPYSPGVNDMSGDAVVDIAQEEAAAAASKFQQQLSGGWNQRVLQQSGGGDWDGVGLEDWGVSSLEPVSVTSPTTSGQATSSSLSVSNAPMTRDDLELHLNEPNSVFSGEEEQHTSLTVQVLKELDNDYRSLRQKLIDLIEQQQQQQANLSSGLNTALIDMTSASNTQMTSVSSSSSNIFPLISPVPQIIDSNNVNTAATEKGFKNDDDSISYGSKRRNYWPDWRTLKDKNDSAVNSMNQIDTNTALISK